MAELTIGQVARRLGMRASALRYYEDEGILPRPRRVNGQRRYSEDLVDLIRVAKFAQSVGFSLSEVRKLSRGLTGRPAVQRQWRPLAMAKVKELDEVIAKAKQMKSAIESGLRCGCIRVEDCVPKKR